MTDDIFGRIQKAAVKISESKNESSLNEKIKAFNASVSQYNEYMDSLLDMIKTETQNLSEIESNHASEVARMLDKYNEIFDTTRTTIIDNTLNIIPDSLNLFKDKENPSYLESDYTTKSQRIAEEIKTKLQDYTNPEDAENRNFVSVSIIPEINKEGSIKKEYELGSYFKIKKDSNVKAVEFGFSIAQYNLSHFNIENEFNIENDNITKYIGDIDNPNIIHRFYRGFIFITDVFDSEKMKIRAKVMLPDTDPIKVYNKTIGPEIDLEFKQDNEFIYIDVNKFTPFRIDWNIASGSSFVGEKCEYFDMLDEEHINNSKIFFEVHCFFDDITRKDVYNTNDEIATLENWNKSDKIDFDLSLSPSKGGFIKFINFDYSTNKNLIAKPKVFYFNTHEIDKKIGDTGFNEFKLLNSDDLKDKNILSLSIWNEFLIALTDTNIYKKHFGAKSFTALLHTPSKGFAAGKNIVDKTHTLEILTKDFGVDSYKDGVYEYGEDPSSEINSYIASAKEAKYIPSLNSFLVYSDEGIFLYRYSNGMYDIRFLYHLTSSDKIEKDMETRLFTNEKFAYFVADNRITKFDLSNLSNITTIIVVDKVLEGDKIISVFYNKKMEKTELLYQNIGSGAYKVILDLDSTPFAERALTSSIFNDSEVKIYNHPFTDNILLTFTKESETKIGFVDPTEIVENDFNPDLVSFECEKGTNKFYDVDPETGSILFYNGNLFVAKGVSFKRRKTFDAVREDILSTLKNESVIRGNENLLYKLRVFGADLEKTFGDFNLNSSYDEFGIFKNFEKEGFDFYNTKTTLFAVNKTNRSDVYIATSSPNNIDENNKQDARKFKMNHVTFPMGVKEIIGNNLGSDNEYFIGTDGEIYQFGNYTIGANKQVLVKPRKINNPGYINSYNLVAVRKDNIFVSDGINSAIINASSLSATGNAYTKLEGIDANEVAVSGNSFVAFKNGEDRITKIFFINSSNVLSEIECSGNIYGDLKEIVGTVSGYIFLTNNGDIYKGNQPNNELVSVLSNSDVIHIHRFTKIDRSTNIDMNSVIFDYGDELYTYLIDTDERLLIDTNKSIIENNTYSITLEDINGKKYNYGVSNGYYYGIRFTGDNTSSLIPENVQLGNDKIVKSFVDENKAYLITESGKLYVCGGSNIKHDPDNSGTLLNTDPYLGLGNEVSASTTKEFFFEIEDLPFKPSDIKEIKFDVYVTFILLENGNLYTCGSDYYGNMGIDSVREENNYFIKDFKLVAKKVNNIWTGNNRSIIEKTEKKKKVYYGAGSNKDGKLGALNNNEYRVWTKISSLDTEIETIKEIFCFDNNTFVLTESGILYTTGENSFGQLGLDDSSNVYEFKRVPNVTKVEKIISSKDNKLILVLDSSGEVYYSGISQSIGLNSRTFVKIPLASERKATNIAISYDASYILFFLETNSGDRKVVKYDVNGFDTEIEYTLGNVKKVVTTLNYIFTLTEDGRIVAFFILNDTLTSKDFYSASYEANGNSLAYTKYKDIIGFYSHTNTAIKFIDSDNVPGIIYEDNSLLKSNGLGVGIGKIRSSGTGFNLAKMYLGTSNFDETSEAVHSARNVEDYDEHEMDTVDTGKIMDCKETMNGKSIGVELTIYPASVSYSEIEGKISGSDEESGFGEFSVELK